MDNSLTISGTLSLDTGKYTCVASNGLDEDEASAQLIAQGQFFSLSLKVSFQLMVQDQFSNLLFKVSLIL